MAFDIHYIGLFLILENCNPKVCYTPIDFCLGKTKLCGWRNLLLDPASESC